MFYEKTETNCDTAFKINVLKIIKFASVFCLGLTLLIGCQTPQPDSNVNDEKDMVLIPAGEFEMGNIGPVEDGPYGPQKDELPLHTVYVDAFYIDKYEVTNADFKKFLDANPQFQKEQINQKVFLKNQDTDVWNGNTYPYKKDHHPVNVTWFEAMAYAKWVGKRLPTEAEWEKAARGGLKNKVYPWGNSRPTTNLANYEVNRSTVSVGSYPPNGYGLYDMAGNVWEWCLDVYQTDFYKKPPKRNPIADADNIMDIINNYNDVKSPRVMRGDGWVFGPDQIRVSIRAKQSPIERSRSFGFRCVKPVER